MIDELIDNCGWIQTIDGYSLSESHPFYVESIFGGVRVIWENNSIDFYEVGRLHDTLWFVGLISNEEWWEYEGKEGVQSPPPLSPTPPNDTPLVEAAATTAASGDEITVDKLENEGWYVGGASPHINHYDHDLHNNITIEFRRMENEGRTTWELEDVALMVIEEGRSLNITTMTELRTLIKWLS